MCWLSQTTVRSGAPVHEQYFKQVTVQLEINMSISCCVECFLLNTSTANEALLTLCETYFYCCLHSKSIPLFCCWKALQQQEGLGLHQQQLNTAPIWLKLLVPTFVQACGITPNHSCSLASHKNSGYLPLRDSSGKQSTSQSSSACDKCLHLRICLILSF